MTRLLTLLAALSLCVPAFGDGLGEARALVDQKRYAEAIRTYDSLLAADPRQVDLLIEVARVHAWADRHATSAALYRRALEAAPARRHDILLPLAWQLAWDGRHDEAIPLFREAATDVPAQRTEALHGLAESLAARNDLRAALDIYNSLAADAADLRARKGEARMLLWLDRNEAAAARYRAILRDHPQDKEARLGLARALNHDDRHFEALGVYAEAIAGDPALARDTRVERAAALRWAGLDEAATQTLGDAAGKDAAALRQRLRQETASHLRGEIESAWDSDDLDVRALGLGWQQRLGAGRLLDVAARTARIVQRGERIDGRQVQMRASTRLGDTEHGLLWPSLSLGVRDYDGWTTALWKLQGKWLPADHWRVDLEAGNDVIENVRSIQNKVTLDAVSASADWRFAPRWRATAGSALLRFDDGNRRARLIGRVEHVIKTTQPRLVLGLEGMGFTDSTRSQDATGADGRGYYNPHRYREMKAFARTEHEAAGWQLEARLALGKLWETPWGAPRDSSGLFAWEFSAARDLAPTLRMRAYAGGSDSSGFLQGAGSGYTRNYVGASLTWFH